MEIQFKDVSYIYQENSPFAHQALENISFTVESGSFVAVIGHTGSGKSTLIQHLNGLSLPSRGEITIGDFRLTSEGKPKDIRDLRKKVGVVFQYPEHQLFEETVAKDIAFGPKNFDVGQEEIDARIEKLLPAVGLPEEILERSPFDLSGGQKRRVAIAGVLAMGPEVLVLDEPTAGLDPRGQREIMDMFYQLHQERNLTTVLVTHSMEDALAYADKIIILNKGQKYMEGAPLDVFKQVDKLQEVQLGIPEVIHFLNQYNERFGTSLNYQYQPLQELANEIKRQLGVGSDE
ncbi:energy-coupling factor ABC transporter ATP-binding protein [Oceanobacillus sp. CFH 90083]|uniref:energy-coupling factor ABC transporter ATP-binding protein n=1 Tax=Oceanobacillus sp. CFH 90083 TaxID=2592336 RepID=UPI00128C5C76|nr:energy-coupling factor ABC transporter ATP-binding protein [Oceanobacillus sp. CFH 90083]